MKKSFITENEIFKIVKILSNNYAFFEKILFSVINYFLLTTETYRLLLFLLGLP